METTSSQAEATTTASANIQKLNTQQVFYSYSDLIEESDQSRLAMIRATLSECYFIVGDIAVKYVIGNARKNALKVTSERLYEAVGYFCGRSARTVRYYAENAIFFPADVREAYKELPFSYFDLARSFGNQWQDVLDYAMENISMNYDAVAYNCRKLFILGHPIMGNDDRPVLDQDDPQKSEWENPMREFPTKEISTPAEASAQVLLLVNSLSDLAEKISRLSREVGLSTDVLVCLDESLAGLRSVIPRIAALMNNEK